MNLWLFVLATFIGFAAVECRPNVVFIVADDLGWNDLGFHNPDIISPNLDKLAKTGVILNQSYVQYLCTPSRNTFMTGYYPFRTGLQHGNFDNLIPAGVPIKFSFLPEKMRSLGYATHMVGKWNLGYCNWSYTPTYRGFDTFLGYYTAAETYFTHEDNGHLDFRNNTDVERNLNGTYSTVIFQDRATEIINNHDHNKPLFLYLPFQAVHAPLQAPDSYIEKYRNIKDVNRRNFSAMVTAMDDAVGNVINALKLNNLYDNTVIIFTTDNGGEVLYGGNNFPLRGNKATLWEGGTRGIAFVHSRLLNKTGYINNELMHSVDWFPTIVSMAGGQIDDNMDGLDQWPMIRDGSKSARNEFVYNIDNYKPNSVNAAIRIGDYKLIAGNPGVPDGWYPAPKNSVQKLNLTMTIKVPNLYLFNLKGSQLGVRPQHRVRHDTRGHKSRPYTWRTFLGRHVRSKGHSPFCPGNWADDVQQGDYDAPVTPYKRTTRRTRRQSGPHSHRRRTSPLTWTTTVKTSPATTAPGAVHRRPDVRRPRDLRPDRRTSSIRFL